MEYPLTDEEAAAAGRFFCYVYATSDSDTVCMMSFDETDMGTYVIIHLEAKGLTASYGFSPDTLTMCRHLEDVWSRYRADWEGGL